MVLMILVILIFLVIIYILILNLLMLYSCINIYKIKEMLKYVLKIKGMVYFLMYVFKYIIYKLFEDVCFVEVYLMVW